MDFDPYPPTLHEDPYPVYRRLRDEFPVCHNPELSFWALSRHDEVKSALLDPEPQCSGQGITVGLGELRQSGPLAAPMRISRAASRRRSRPR